MGRPPVEDPRSEAVQIRLTSAEAERIDEERGRVLPGVNLSRAAWVRWLVDGYLNGRLVPAAPPDQRPASKPRKNRST